MYSYTMIQWLFFFYFYCFFGWCFESAVVSVSKRKLVNRGFMRGPFLPLYGTGGIMMLVVSMPFQDNIVMVYIAGCIGATALEYVTGVVMESLFKIRYWDYSDKKFQFQGHICLSSTLAWGFLTILMTEVVHRLVEQLVLSIPEGILTGVTLLLTAYICGDFALSFRAALDLRDVLSRMERAKEELLHVQKRLDVIIAVANEDIANRKEEITESIETRVEDIKNSIEEKLEGIRRLAQTRPSGYLDSVREEIGELLLKYRKNIEERDGLSRPGNFFQRDMIRSNPSMSSSRFQEALEELKKWADRKHKDREEKDS